MNKQKTIVAVAAALAVAASLAVSAASAASHGLVMCLSCEPPGAASPAQTQTVQTRLRRVQAQVTVGTYHEANGGASRPTTTPGTSCASISSTSERRSSCCSATRTTRRSGRSRSRSLRTRPGRAAGSPSRPESWTAPAGRTPLPTRTSACRTASPAAGRPRSTSRPAAPRSEPEPAGPAPSASRGRRGRTRRRATPGAALAGVRVSPVVSRAAVCARAALAVRRRSTLLRTALDPGAPILPDTPVDGRLLGPAPPETEVPRRDRHPDRRGDQPGDRACVKPNSPHAVTVCPRLTLVKLVNTS